MKNQSKPQRDSRDPRLQWNLCRRARWFALIAAALVLFAGCELEGEPVFHEPGNRQPVDRESGAGGESGDEAGAVAPEGSPGGDGVPCYNEECEPEAFPAPAPTVCASLRCPEDTYCDDQGGTAECIALPSCDEVECKDGFHCQLIDVECASEPCPPPSPQCVLPCYNEGCEPEPVPAPAPGSCAAVLCPEDTYCDDQDGTAECIALSPCDELECEDGFECQLIDVECASEPCSSPIPQCVLPCYNEECEPEPFPAPSPASCADVRCPEDTYCDDRDGPAECIALPSCDGVECGSGEHCQLVEVQCVSAPCPPRPQCG